MLDATRRPVALLALSLVAEVALLALDERIFENVAGLGFDVTLVTLRRTHA